LIPLLIPSLFLIIAVLLIVFLPAVVARRRFD
jgi:competence protein ComGC